MAANGVASAKARALVRIVGYYVVVGVVVGFLWWRFPILETLLTLGELPDASREITQTMAGDVDLTTEVAQGWPGLVVATGSLVGTLLFMIPVAWTYIFIKKNEGYDESVVHTLIILPIAVTGIVLIVKGSLALAFSLAGIVAAVRFRTTLDDTKDAVYVFLAIGVGLASGVQALGVAAALSFVFNAVNLILWRMSFGNIYADQLSRTQGLGLGDVIAGPESRKTALSIGDSRLTQALTPKDLKEVADRMARTDRYLRAESDSRKERKKFSVLMIHSDQVGGAQASVEPILERGCIRWSLAEVIPGEGEISVLEYLVRLRDDVVEGELLDALRKEAGAVIRAAEIRSLKQFVKRS